VSEDPDLVVGAEAIRRDIFQNRISTRAVYRVAEQEGWPIWRLRGKLATRISICREHEARLAAEAMAARDSKAA
jgi:hypothetical protein